MLNMADLKKMKAEELKAKVVALKSELFNKNFQSYTVGTQKPHEVKNIKKDIARLLTAISAKNKA